MLDHLVGLLVRVLNAQVTGTKPLQVHSAGMRIESLMRFMGAPPAARHARAAFSAEMLVLAGEGQKSARIAPHGNGGNQASTGA
jgi:hypothetical protein